MMSADLLVDDIFVERVIVTTEGFGFSVTATAPICTTVVLRNLVTGASVSGPEQCHGDLLASELGPQALQPDSPEIASMCGANNSMYACEVDEGGGAWNPELCTSWPEDQATTGAEPTTGGGGGTAGEPGASTTGGSASGGASSPGDDGLVSHGCACATRGPAPGLALVWLLVVVGAVPRRRRAS